MGLNPYTQEWRDSVRAGVQASARALVPHLYSAFQPKSVIDVGCGEGWFLKEFAELGVTRLYGVELDDPLFRHPGISYVTADLRESLPNLGTFDLALCLEVAEHLPEECAERLVGSLCRLSDRVVFSAAIPGQGGNGHVNEQWASYWIEKFAARGFGWSAGLRMALWEHPAIEVWYVQNLLVFERGPGVGSVADVVHPRLWALYRGVEMPCGSR